MTIDFTCQKCDASFEIDMADLLDGTEPIKCPNCDAKAPQALVEELSSALGDVCKHIAALRKKFELSLALESDDLPPPYDLDEDEEEEDEEDEGGEDEDLFDEDEEDEDEDEDEEDGDEDEDDEYR